MNNSTINAPKGALGDQTFAGFRQLLLIVGGFAVANGNISQGDLETVVGAVVIVGSFLYGQWKTRRRAQQVSTLADHVPDIVARKG